MATSGSTDYSVNRNQIITEALELLGVLPAGDTADTNDVTSLSLTLNLMIKHWQSRGVALWKNAQIVVFLELSAQSYSLGPTGDKACLLSDMVKTEVAAAAASGATTLVVDSITSMASGDIIGIELDGGDLQWTTINGAPASATITLTAALTDDVNLDAHVYTYTTATIPRPLFVTEGRLHQNSDQEIPLSIIGRNKYMRLTSKTSTGPASQIYYDPLRANGELYVWPTASTVKDYLILNTRMPLEDFDGSTDDPDFPQEWMLPLAWNLAVLAAPKFGITLSQQFETKAGMFLTDAMDSAVDFGSIYFESDEER